MNKPIPATTYAQLVKAIQEAIAAGRAKIQETQAETYWQVGEFISEYILHGADRAKYGEHIFENLSKDLKIARQTLQQTVHFYREFPISRARDKLTWTHVRDLLSLPDDSRKELINKTLKEDLTTRELKEEIDRRKILHIPTDGPIPKLKFERGTLYTYKVIEPPSLQPVEGYKFVDCGFNIWREIPLASLGKFKDGDLIETFKAQDGYKVKSSKGTKKDLYVFKAAVERIIDGDTILVHVDCGFETWKRQDLRFRGINCPELSTKEGQAVKRFIEARIKPNDFVVIKTHKDDKYGRYLVDVFYLPGEKDAAKVAAEGIYLNQELLDNRLAVGMKR